MILNSFSILISFLYFIQIFSIFQNSEILLNGEINNLNIPSLSETVNLLNLNYDGHILPYHPESIKYNTSFVTRQHPYVISIPGSRTTACAAKFRSLSSRAINMWWDDGQNGVFQGTLLPGQESTTNTYEGHVFFFY